MKNLGEQFIWWYGVVEDRADPLELGRVRVRCYGWHTDNKNDLPTNDLPWGQAVQPITSAAMGDIGTSPTGIVEGTWVVGFFADGEEAQRPIVMGTIAGIPTSFPDTTKGFNDPNGVYPSEIERPDVDSRARGINSITKIPDSTIGEPADPYNALYPMNHTHRSESGHLIEIDDTTDAERIHVYHRSGTFIEIHPNGDVVTQHKNGWRSVTGNDKVHITGNMTLVVDGDMNTTIGGNQYTTITGETHTRNEGVLYTYIGDDTHTTKASDKTDYTTPSIRESGTPATEPTSS